MEPKNAQEQGSYLQIGVVIIIIEFRYLRILKERIMRLTGPRHLLKPACPG